MGVAVLVGTRKGLFLLTSDEAAPRLVAWRGRTSTGWEVFHAMRDPRDGTLHAATNHLVYGATTHRSTDLGETWERAEEIGLPEESGLTWEKSWHVEPGHADEPETLWLGGTPGALFRSDDGGSTWAPVQSLVEHSTRDQLEPRRRRPLLPLDPARPVRPAAALHRDLGRRRLPQRRRRRDLGAEELGRRGRLLPGRHVPGGRPVRAQAARAPGAARAALAAEPLRRLPLRRPRRHLGAARGQRPAERASASRSRSTRPTPTRPTSSPRRARRTASPRTGGSASTGRATPARPGSS